MTGVFLLFQKRESPYLIENLGIIKYSSLAIERIYLLSYREALELINFIDIKTILESAHKIVLKL